MEESRATSKHKITAESISVPLLHPPGAVDTETFLQKCTGAGRCVEACPHGSISLMSLEGQNIVPVINPAISPCFLCEPAPCADACESGALEQIDMRRVRMGIANLDPYLCLRFGGEDCTVCYDSCPLKDEAILWEEEIEAPLINMDKCTGCGVCMFKCPAPERPISIVIA
ncbi:MAG TPA: 4Fe-4S binding protein [Acidobacteriota bacterium]|nr:4Fe-4S binding protein [Acidobacteriota bacterium]